MSVAEILARELKVSGRTVRRAVDRELLRGQRQSPNRLEIAAEERRYAHSHWGLLQTLVGALRTEPSVEAAILFGSTARGDDRDDSDVDVAVRLRPDAAVSVRDLRVRLERSLGRDVDLVTLDEAAAEPSFLLEIIDEGRPLIDRGGCWRGLVRRRTALSREAAARRAERNRAAHAVWNQLGE